MNNTVNPDMIILARESRGVTQSDLAEAVGVTQAFISRAEKGLSGISEELLENISSNLGYPISFFYKAGHRYPPSTPFHRKRKALPKKTQYQIEALANIRTLHLDNLLQSVEFLENKIRYLDLDDYNNNPRDVARAVRSYLKLPRGPIKNLTSVLEDIGIIIIHCDFGTSLIDGFTLIARKNHPVIFVNQDIPGDRMRFTLAHEFGHMVMHEVPKPTMEDEANKFASEFLIPEQEIRPSFSEVTLRTLATLKPYWRVSMAALLECAHQVGKVSDNQRRWLWAAMAKQGYTKREPAQLDITVEKPALFREILDVHFDELGFSTDELYQSLSTYSSDFLKLYPDVDRKKTLRVIK